MYRYDKDKGIDQALLNLDDAICSFERSTGIEFSLVLKDSRGFQHRSSSGKPMEGLEDITNEQFLHNL